MRSEELRRLVRGEFGDGRSVEALVDQFRAAGHEAVELFRARLSADDETRAAGEAAWHAIVGELPEPKPLEEQARDRLGDGLRALNAFLEEAIEREGSRTDET